MAALVVCKSPVLTLDVTLAAAYLGEVFDEDLGELPFYSAAFSLLLCRCTCSHSQTFAFSNRGGDSENVSGQLVFSGAKRKFLGDFDFSSEDL